MLALFTGFMALCLDLSPFGLCCSFHEWVYLLKHSNYKLRLEDKGSYTYVPSSISNYTAIVDLFRKHLQSIFSIRLHLVGT